MKKIIAILCCAVMLLSMAACGSTTASTDTETTGAAVAVSDGETIQATLDAGYWEYMSTYGDGTWRGLFVNDETGSYLKITADFPSDLEDQLMNISVFDDDYTDQVNAIVGSLTVTAKEDLTSQVPSQETLDAYVGKTFADLEADGYDRCGWSGDEETGEYNFQFESNLYCLTVELPEGVTIDNMDEFSENDDAINALEIGSVTFTGFSFGAIE